MRRQVDLLVVASNTTMGLWRATTTLERALEALGVTYVSVTPDFRIARRVVHRDMLVIDLAQAVELRWATGRALRRYRPRALLFTTTHAALLQPDRVRTRPCAISFDSPAAVNRRGRRFALEHLLERLNFRHARVLLPLGARVPSSVGSHMPRRTRVASLPVPISESPEPAADQSPGSGRTVLTYARSARAKGLDLAVEAWAAARRPGWQLEVTGIRPDEGRAYLAARGIAEPEGVIWRGSVDPAEYRRLSRRAAVYLGASRVEPYGLAQLEALADGCLLATVPSDGPFEALALARQLDSRLVADGLQGSALARSLDTALSYSDEARGAYARRAHELLSPYTWPSLIQQLERDVLPLLLS